MKIKTTFTSSLALLLVIGALSGCSDAEDTGTPSSSEEFEVPQTYAFESRFVQGESSVSYTGQTSRQLLIEDLKAYIGGLSDEIDGGTFLPGDGDVRAGLDFYFRFDSEAFGGESPRLRAGDAELKQAKYGDVISNKDLVGKLAGNDSATDHKDFSNAFVGWQGATSPEGLMTQWFDELDDLAAARANGETRMDAAGNQLPVYVTDDGRDLQQLTQKFLHGALSFHQAADDYLDDDTEGKGLLADNTEAASDRYTALEHAWDEAFGYFGAARDYADYTDEELAARGGREGYAAGFYDTNGDGMIDLEREFNFGVAPNAAKRDLGAVVATDFTAEAFEGFAAGRALIAANGALDAEQMEELKMYRDQAVGAWEKTIAATVVHYINETIVDTQAVGGDDYDFAHHAKVWSEMKGFALAFQFNPHSPMSAQDFSKMHDLMGTSPVLADAGDQALENYVTDLVAARDILERAYEFAPENMGDANGEGGW